MVTAAPTGRGAVADSYLVRESETGRFKRQTLTRCVVEGCRAPAYSGNVCGQPAAGECVVHARARLQAAEDARVAALHARP